MFLALINELIGLPENASEHGKMVDLMMEMVHWFMAALGVGWSIFLAIAIWKFRAGKNKSADYQGVKGHASTHVEMAVIIVEAVLLVGFAFPLWKMRIDEYPTGPDVVKIRAVGYQFGWLFHYPGEDGLFGKTDPRYFHVNNVGMKPGDPAGADDVIVSRTLKIPLGRDIVMDIISKDVIHNLALVPMRMAQDAIPGVRANVWFTPKKIGEWDIICGQLCGSGHANMTGVLEVQSETDFFAWHQSESASAYAKSLAKGENNSIAQN